MAIGMDFVLSPRAVLRGDYLEALHIRQRQILVAVHLFRHGPRLAQRLFPRQSCEDIHLVLEGVSCDYSSFRSKMLRGFPVRFPTTRQQVHH